MSNPSPAVPQQKFEQIPIALIEPSKDNPRKEFNHESMHDLTASIRVEGIVEPILVRPKKNGEVGFEIIAGERRFRAAKNAGLATVPSVVRDVGDAEAHSLRLVENIQRSDLTLAEECAAVEQLMKECTLEEVCAKLGKSKPWVSKRHTAKDLPVPVKKLVTTGKLGDLEIAHGLGQMLTMGDETLKENAESAIDDLANPRQYSEPVTREWIRDSIENAKEAAKRRDEAQKQAAKAQRAAPDKPSPAETAARALERKRARLSAERKEFKDKAEPALFEALEIKPSKNSWNNPVRLDYGESLSALTKLPATVDGCDFKISADADIVLLKRLAAGLPKPPMVRCQLPELTLAQAQKVSDALKELGDNLELGYEVTLTGGDVLKLLSKLSPGRQLMNPASEQIAVFLVKHTKADKAGQVKAGDLWKLYGKWAKSEKLKPLDLVAFGTAVKAAGIEKKRLKTGWHYLGIVLKG